jgi:hypothetical protein
MPHPPENQFIPLSPIDCVFVGPGSYPIEFAFFYGSSLTKSQHDLLLEQAWRTLGAVCPILKARLIERGGCYGLFWDETSEIKPILWQKISGDVHPEQHPNPYDLVDPVTTATGQNLASLKLSEGRDGTTLGLSLSHAVADGFTYFMILNSLASIMRHLIHHQDSNDLPSTVMNHDRRLITTMVHSAQGSSTSTDEVNNVARSLPGFSTASLRSDIPRSSIQSARRHFSKNALHDLYQEFADAPKRLSTNDMICAALWREFARDFDSEKNSDVSLVAPVDFRRLDRTFPRNYAGNAVVLARVDMDRNRLLHGSLIDVAMRVREAVSAVDDRYITNTIRQLAKKMQPDAYAGLGHIHIVDPLAGLLITNLSRMSFTSLDCGGGAPTYCRPLTPCKRAIVLLSDGHDGIVAHIQ